MSAVLARVTRDVADGAAAGAVTRTAALLRAALLTLPLAALAATPTSAAAAPACTWPAWERFAGSYLDPSGRLIDPSTPYGQTTSEGQSYALFFALVAGDRERFARVLKWSVDNLAGGDLSARLPAWQWGRKAEDNWGVIDSNPAGDADLWIAYALQEAGRLWQLPAYTVLGQQVAERILGEETVVLDGLGRIMLPGVAGFHPDPSTARLNPSYLPLQLLRRLADTAVSAESRAQWHEQIGTSTRLIVESAPRGFVPDWSVYRSGNGFAPVTQSTSSAPGVGVRLEAGAGNGTPANASAPSSASTDAIGSYNAIRTYLWAGMLAPGAPARATLIARLRPMTDLVAAIGMPPEHIDSRSGRIDGVGNAGFSAALLPLLTATLGAGPAQVQGARIRRLDPLARHDNYYEQALTLFGVGFSEGRFRFSANGMLRLQESCSAS